MSTNYIFHFTKVKIILPKCQLRWAVGQKNRNLINVVFGRPIMYFGRTVRIVKQMCYKNLIKEIKSSKEVLIRLGSGLKKRLFAVIAHGYA